jgi:hypothetical protein
MTEHICQWCLKKRANSKEHLIVSKRLKEVRSKKLISERNDNVTKTFKGITCKDCNKLLKDYEERDSATLSYVTVWKLLAGNMNNKFSGHQNFLLVNSSCETIKFFGDMLKSAIQNGNVFPNNTFRYSIDLNKWTAKNDTYSYVSNDPLTITAGKTGLPLEGARVYVSGNNEDDIGVVKETGKDGRTELTLPMRVEKLYIIADEIRIENISTGETINKTIDFVFYISHRAELDRIIFFIPLQGKMNTPWKYSVVSIHQKNVRDLININMPEYGICKIRPYFM